MRFLLLNVILSHLVSRDVLEVANRVNHIIRYAHTIWLHVEFDCYVVMEYVPVVLP